MADTTPSDGNRRKGNNPKVIDVASDSKFSWRMFKNFVSMISNDIGRRGFDIGWVSTLTGFLETAFGKATVSGMVFPALAAWIQNPEVLKKYLRQAGLPPEVNGIIDEALDDLIEGVRQGYVQRGRLTENDVDKALVQVQGNLGARMSKFTFAQLVPRLAATDRQRLLVWLGGLSADDRKKFDFYRPKLNDMIALSAFIAQENDQRLSYLEALYGKPPTAPASLGSILNIGKRITHAIVPKAEKSLKDFLENPAANAQAIAEMIDPGMKQAAEAAQGAPAQAGGTPTAAEQRRQARRARIELNKKKRW